MKYFKKKLSIYLLLLLAVLFISLLGTTSYARQITLNELKNFCWNYYYYLYGNTNIENLINNLNSTETETFLQGIVNSANASQGRYILSGVNGYVLYWIYDGNTTNLNKYGPYYNSGNIYVNTSYLTRWRKRYSVYNYTKEDWSAYDTQIQINNNYFFYTDTNIYTNSTIANGSIKYPAGYMTPSDLFDGPYRDDFFIYAPSSLIPNINLNGSYNFSETAQEILFVYNSFESGNPVNQADSVITGYLFDADLFSKAVFTEYAYNYATGKFEYDGRYWETSDIGNIDNNQILVEFLAQNYGTLYKPDTILHAEFQCNTTDFDFVHADFYIRSPHSAIRDGILYPRRNIQRRLCNNK